MQNIHDEQNLNISSKNRMSIWVFISSSFKHLILPKSSVSTWKWTYLKHGNYILKLALKHS